jgi:CubicO group peptidase (beta-lactamase class C family)
MVLKIAVSADQIHGDVDTGYGKVADAFRASFRDGAEVGAAVAVYRDGVKVVDLWGGYRNGVARQPWQPDTMVNMFSTTKGVAALVMAVAVSRGLFSYDARVADYWPEFAQAGKGDVTVRQLLGHQAGLCALKPKPALADVADPDRLAPILAGQVPAWRPGTRHGYHAITLGWYESQLIRRTDPAGRTLGRFLADEIVRPLGLDVHIGLPDSVDRERVAHVHNWVRAETLLHLKVMPPGFVGASLNPVGLTARTIAVPRGVNARSTATTTATTCGRSRSRRPTALAPPGRWRACTAARPPAGPGSAWPGTPSRRWPHRARRRAGAFATR